MWLWPVISYLNEIKYGRGDLLKSNCKYLIDKKSKYDTVFCNCLRSNRCCISLTNSVCKIYFQRRKTQLVCYLLYLPSSVCFTALDQYSLTWLHFFTRLNYQVFLSQLCWLLLDLLFSEVNFPWTFFLSY